MIKNKKLLFWVGLLSSLIIPIQTNASDFSTISIANPDNPSEWITIMDRNLGATSNDISSSDSYGYKYQWWNNYGYSNWCFTNQWRWCSDSITESWKGIWDKEQHEYLNWFNWNDKYDKSWYYETIFYYVDISPWYHWGEWNYHDWLWWGADDNKNNNWWENEKNFEDRQWPCPDGYHVPSEWEWWLLVKYWRDTYGKDITNYKDGYFYSDSSDFRDYFKLPYAGYRGWNDALLYQQGYEGHYRSSSPYWTPEEYEYWDSQEWVSSDISEYARYFWLNINFVGVGGYNKRHNWFPVRCFKNTYESKTIENTTECEWMDKANVNHVTKDGIVTIKWNEVDWNYVNISIYDPEKEIYKTLWTAKMSDKKFSYKVPWAGEHELLLTNGCKEVIYKIEADTVKCEWMDSAKVSHTVDNDTITLKWNTIEWDNVEISIFDPDSESYKNLWTVKMNNKKFTYKIKWEWEQNFLLSNWCNNFNYKVNITKAKKEEITSKYWTISIANPDNKNEWITIMDKNLWATSNDISSSNSYWYYYQWWNNYGFNRKNKISTSSDKATRNSKYDNHWFYDNFFRITSRDYWTDWSHNWLRWWEYDSYDNDWWANEKNPHNRQWPCPDGYHVPSAWEWWLLIKYRKNTYDKNVEIKWGQWQFSFADKTATENFSKFFKLPLAGNLNSYDGSTERQGENWVYWSSSTNIENEGYAEHLYIQYNSSVRDASIGKESTLSQVYATAASPRSEGMPIRCFKNTYDPVSQEVIYEENLEEVIEQLIEEEEDIVIQGKDAQKIEKSNLNPSDILENGYTREMNDAYNFAHEKWITTIDNIENANMNWWLTRIAMAKMLSQYAMNVLWKTPDTSKWTPKFNDVTEKQNSDYNNAVTLSYQLWIMWQNMKNNKFRPNDEVTRAEFTTALSRMLYNIEDGKWDTKYYEPHITKLYNEWVISNRNPDMKEKRWYVMLMLMRSVK